MRSRTAWSNTRDGQERKSPGDLPGSFQTAIYSPPLLRNADLAEAKRVAVGQVLIEPTGERDVDVLRRRIRVPRRLVTDDRLRNVESGGKQPVDRADVAAPHPTVGGDGADVARDDVLEVGPLSIQELLQVVPAQLSRPDRSDYLSERLVEADNHAPVVAAAERGRVAGRVAVEAFALTGRDVVQVGGADATDHAAGAWVLGLHAEDGLTVARDVDALTKKTGEALRVARDEVLDPADPVHATVEAEEFVEPG